MKQILLVVVLLGCVFGSSAEEHRTLRLAVVNTPVSSGLLQNLIPSFEQRSGYHVEITAGENVVAIAAQGRADLLIAHYGKQGIDALITAGKAEWPRMVFSNQVALFGPADDPAGIASTRDPVEAFRRIAATRSGFLDLPMEGLSYLSRQLWHGAGRPDRDGWFMDAAGGKERAITAAMSGRQYFLFGLIPYHVRSAGSSGETVAVPLLQESPLFLRVMVSLVMQLPESDRAGARALQEYLLEPETQARILAYRMANIEQPVWWPAARHNNPHVLTVGDKRVR